MKLPYFRNTWWIYLISGTIGIYLISSTNDEFTSFWRQWWIYPFLAPMMNLISGIIGIYVISSTIDGAIQLSYLISSIRIDEFTSFLAPIIEFTSFLAPKMKFPHF